MGFKVIKVKRGHGHGFKKKLVKLPLEQLKDIIAIDTDVAETESIKEIELVEDTPPLVEKPKESKAKNKGKK